MRFNRLWLLLALLLLLSPGIWLVFLGMSQGYDVPRGLVGAVRSVTGQDLVYSVPVVIDPEPIPAEHRRVVWTGDLANEQLKEASGLAPSYRKPDVYFSMNDSGNAAELFALRSDGTHAGVWAINYSGRHDFEDMAAFAFNGERYLLVADTGDNLYWRPVVRLLIIAEPDLDRITEEALEPAWVINLRYPDGPRDVEAVAVDEATEQVFLISKRRIPPEIFCVPLRPDEKLVTATYVGRLGALPQPSGRDLREDPEWGSYRSSPTALGMKGDKAVVITYRDGYLFSRRKGESWVDAFAKAPERIPLPHLRGLEAGTFHASENKFLIVNERKEGVGRASLYRVDL